MTAEHSSHTNPPALAQLLSTVAHELRSPLNTINGFLDLTLEEVAGPLNEQQQDFLQRARAGSEHLYTLLEDVLLIARADAGQLRLHLASCSLEELVDAAYEEVELTAREAEVTVELVLPPDLPAIVADAVRVRHILRNLLSNALHATPAGGRVTISARVSPLSQEDRKLEVRVSDTGCGIEPVYHEQVFERFFRIPREDGGRSGGLGLGLAVVKLLIELHGGRMLVESEPGKGSSFLFTLDVFV